MPIQKVNGLYKSMSPIMDKEKMSKIESDVLNLLQGITLSDSMLILENITMYIQVQSIVPKAFSFSDNQVLL